MGDLDEYWARWRARSFRAQLAARPKRSEPRCQAIRSTREDGYRRRRCVRRARWVVCGREYCTIHAKRARRESTLGHIKPAMAALERPPAAEPCSLCRGREVLYVDVGADRVERVPCVCTPAGRERVNGRPDAEVLRELAGDGQEGDAAA